MTLLLSIIGSIVAVNLLVILILAVVTKNRPDPHTLEETEEQAEYVSRHARK